MAGWNLRRIWTFFPKMGKNCVLPLQLLQSSNSSVAPCVYCSFVSWPSVQEHLSLLVGDHPNSSYKCVVKWRGPQTFFLELFHVAWCNCEFAGLTWESASTLLASWLWNFPGNENILDLVLFLVYINTEEDLWEEGEGKSGEGSSWDMCFRLW